MKAQEQIQVPLVDLDYQHRLISEELARSWQEIFESSSYIAGPFVARFEKAFADFCGIPHCIGVANGTDAIELCLRAAGIGLEDEVIVPANSFVATAFAVARAGGRPRFVDVDARTLLIDPDAVREELSGRTKAVIPVHLFGQLAPMEEVQEVVGDEVTVIEDAAQAQGAKRFGRSAGAFGIAAAMSFYPSKNLGAYGDAGAVLTESDDFAARVRALRNYGGDSKNVHPHLGFNSRLDSIQAAVLLAKLPHLERWNEERREAVRYYDELLLSLHQVATIGELEGNEHVWYVYVVRVPQRDEVLQRLNSAGIGAAIHYPTPIHLQPPFRELGYEEGDFPQAEAAANEILSLPLSPGITRAQQERVIAELGDALSVVT